MTAPNGRELYYLQFSLQAASLEAFGYMSPKICTCVMDILLQNILYIQLGIYLNIMQKNILTAL